MTIQPAIDAALATDYAEDGLIHLRPLFEKGKAAEVKSALFHFLEEGDSADTKHHVLDLFYFLYGTGSTGVSGEFGDTREEMVRPPSFDSRDFIRLMRAAMREFDPEVLGNYASLVDCISDRRDATNDATRVLLATCIAHMCEHGDADARRRFGW